MASPKFITFKVENFRSISTEIAFTMLADKSISNRKEHTFDFQLKDGEIVKLLRTAAIYGPNASGKSNLLRAFWTFRDIVTKSGNNNLQDKLMSFDPCMLVSLF